MRRGCRGGRGLDIALMMLSEGESVDGRSAVVGTLGDSFRSYALMQLQWDGTG